MACALTRCHAPTRTVASPITIPRNPTHVWLVKYMLTFYHVQYGTFTRSNFLSTGAKFMYYREMTKYPVYQKLVNYFTDILPAKLDTCIIYT